MYQTELRAGAHCTARPAVLGWTGVRPQRDRACEAPGASAWRPQPLLACGEPQTTRGPTPHSGQRRQQERPLETENSRPLIKPPEARGASGTSGTAPPETVSCPAGGSTRRERRPQPRPQRLEHLPPPEQPPRRPCRGRGGQAGASPHGPPRPPQQQQRRQPPPPQRYCSHPRPLRTRASMPRTAGARHSLRSAP